MNEDAPNDEDAIMDHVALEAINAVHARDHEAYLGSLHALVSNIVSKMQSPEGEGEGE